MADSVNVNSGSNDEDRGGSSDASAKVTTSLLVPIVTAVVLIAIFCGYYFVYVRARREYLANRNFRELAVLGDQLQATLRNYGSILEGPARQFYNENRPDAEGRLQEEQSQFLVKTIPGMSDDQARMAYLKHLAPGFQLSEIQHVSRHGPKLEIDRRDGRWQIVLTASAPDNPHIDFVGSLDPQEVLRPFVGSLPFDDILVASESGLIVYEKTKSGPQFTTLTDLLSSQVDTAAQKPKSDSGSAVPEPENGRASSSEARGKAGGAPAGPVKLNADGTWRLRSLHLTEVMLAGTHYKLFLQPVLVDTYSDPSSPDRPPAREWVLCGLTAASALEWEALAISYSLVIWITALFFVICLSGPMLKTFFLNRRERFRLRELGFLGLFFVLLSGVLTLCALQGVYFHLHDDETEAHLEQLGDALSRNIHVELRQMRAQLRALCAAPELLEDLARAKKSDVIRKVTAHHTARQSGGSAESTPEASIYPYFSNVFWTDYDGHQIVKWSASEYVTPMIDVSQLASYRHLRQQADHPLLYMDGRDPQFDFDSVLPPNKLDYQANLGMTTCQCNPRLCSSGGDGTEGQTHGAVFLVGRPLSLIDPILPYGYGFALLDTRGQVLFHSDKTKNLRENFYRESDSNQELYAAMFGHSTRQSLRLQYLGKDYQARVIPIPGVAQAPWSLVVYRDLTGVRTLNLQTMTMASTLFVAFLAGPVILVVIWYAIQRPRFVAEWLWPHPGRIATYWYHIAVFSLFILLFLFLGFQPSSEDALIACAAVPYTALLLTLWCCKLYPSSGQERSTNLRRFVVPAALTAVAGAGFLVVAIHQWPNVTGLTALIGLGAIAALPLLDKPRQHLVTRFNHRPQTIPAGDRAEAHPARHWLDYRTCYTLSILLLLLLVGVLAPMALFRASLGIERRLRVKQAQLHLASAIERQQAILRSQCASGERGLAACRQFQTQGVIGKDLGLTSLYAADASEYRFAPQQASPPAVEPYSGWLRRAIYTLHHDYNQAAAEMLGVISDRAERHSRSDFPEWDWLYSDRPPTITLRKHGAHRLGEAPGEESDLIIDSRLPSGTWTDGLLDAGVALGVMLVIGGLFWALAQKVFLFHILPLKITGARKVAQSLREGRNVLVLVPPVSNWQLDGPKWTLDVSREAGRPNWAELMDLATIPVNTVIEILHFEHTTNDPEIDNQKFVLVQRLLQREDTQVAVVMTVGASHEEHHRVLPALEPVDLREEPFPWLAAYEGPARNLIWRECGPMPALWPIGAQLARDIQLEKDRVKDAVYTEDSVASEIRERADPYYRLVWRECSREQKFVLAQLATDGLLNPMNGRAIRQLVRRGLIVKDPQFRIMNESFRRFLRAAPAPEMQREWQRESRASGWGKAHGAFVTVMIVVGVFLLTTQNGLWQSSAAYVTTAIGGLGTLFKLFNTFRGAGGPEEKAN